MSCSHQAVWSRPVPGPGPVRETETRCFAYMAFAATVLGTSNETKPLPLSIDKRSCCHGFVYMKPHVRQVAVVHLTGLGKEALPMSLCAGKVTRIRRGMPRSTLLLSTRLDGARRREIRLDGAGLVSRGQKLRVVATHICPVACEVIAHEVGEIQKGGCFHQADVSQASPTGKAAVTR